MQTMIRLDVSKLTASVAEARHIPAELDRGGVPFHDLDCINWPDFPYRPLVKFRIAYTSDALLLQYHVEEQSVRASYGTDNDPVWNDSCVEFFSIPAADGCYYNLECNCIGSLLLGAGTDRKDRRRAPAEVLETIGRWASLGSEPFGERNEPTAWDVAIRLPFTAFFMHRIGALDGKHIRANFYKCGDKLAVPHFLSWSPIDVPEPNFHQPDFFGQLYFKP